MLLLLIYITYSGGIEGIGRFIRSVWSHHPPIRVYFVDFIRVNFQLEFSSCFFRYRLRTYS